MKKMLITYLSVAAFITHLYAYSDSNHAKQKITHQKYEEINKENFITLNDFDEWLMRNDHYEKFVNAYNTSPDHLIVEKLKCLYELKMLQGEEEMLYDEMKRTCSQIIK